MKVYKITNKINEKVYIGKYEGTDEKFENYMGSGLLINRAYEKYGIENFEKEIIERCDNRDTLAERERYWISKYNSQALSIGYNIMSGGDGGDTLTNHPDIDLIKEKISTKGKGREFSEEHRKKLSEAGKGRKHTEESLNKMKGRPKSEEHKKKLAQGAKEQWKRQKAEDYKVSDETKRLLSEKRKQWWAEKKKDKEYMKMVSERNRKAAKSK